MTDAPAPDAVPATVESSSLPAPKPAPGPPPRRSGWAWVALLVALTGAGVWLWYSDHQRAERERAAEIATAQRIEALESRLDGVRRDIRGHGQRLQQADATNRLLRDELLGMGQRAALLEDQIGKLADANRTGAQALRLDEAELLLTLGQQRLLLAADLDGARHAYALAAGVLDRIDGPDALSLRQALVQERAALDALTSDPRRDALARLDALAAALPDRDALPRPAVADPKAAWWERVLSRLVSVRRGDAPPALASGDRQSGEIALQLELSLARIAIERRDAEAMRAALQRADGWILRLWPASAERDAIRARLLALQDAPLTPTLPTLGTTLAQLQALRGPQ
jgi:uroporphyrin-3 C-methyltransferase